MVHFVISPLKASKPVVTVYPEVRKKMPRGMKPDKTSLQV